MDAIADTGSRWFCAAAHTVGTSSFEMQACGDSGLRFWIGIATVFAAALLGIIAFWRVGERRAG